MKNLIVSSNLILLSTFALFSSAHAACPDVNTITAPSVLIGTTVCVVNESQEFHEASGNLIDYKRGDSDPVDPTESVGSWSIDANNNNITYTYGGTSFNYTLQQATGATSPTSYCNTSTNDEIFIDQVISGLNQCNWAAPSP